ncbi:MAG: hypothetical protein ACMXYA_02040 [Candidatus Woesearchaeota archaeon]
MDVVTIQKRNKSTYTSLLQDVAARAKQSKKESNMFTHTYFMTLDDHSSLRVYTHGGDIWGVTHFSTYEPRQNSETLLDIKTKLHIPRKSVTDIVRDAKAHNANAVGILEGIRSFSPNFGRHMLEHTIQEAQYWVLRDHSDKPEVYTDIGFKRPDFVADSYDVLSLRR